MVIPSWILPLLGFLSTPCNALQGEIKPDTLVSRTITPVKRHLPHKPYNISFYHLNDVHAHLDQFRSSGSSCTNPAAGCVGGYARVKSVVSDTRPTHKNSLFLNAGDEFQGTLFYALYKGEAISVVLNQLGFDAMTLGNHEFDDGDDLLASFINNLTFPVISSNIETKNKALAKGLMKYKLFPKHSLAIVAVTTETTPTISKPGNGTIFAAPVKAVQDTVNHIRIFHPHIQRIVALTHIGYEEDILLAQKTRGFNLIIGGHSHTLLGDMPEAAGPYPTIAHNLDGEEVFVVTSYRWGEYLGYIDVAYQGGKVVGYTGAPIHLTNTTALNSQIQKNVDRYAAGFEQYSRQVLGVALSPFVQSTCQTQECNLGDFTADAMLAYREAAGADLAIMNAGGIRVGMEAGNITLQQSLECFPFGNSVVEVKFTGAELWRIVEGTISRTSTFNSRPVTSFAQWSQTLRVQYNPNNPIGRRVISMGVKGQELVKDRVYNVVTIDFLAGGGDNFWEAGMGGSWVALRALDDVWAEALGTQSPVDIKLDGRLSVTQESTPGLEI